MCGSYNCIHTGMGFVQQQAMQGDFWRYYYSQLNNLAMTTAQVVKERATKQKSINKKLLLLMR